MQKKIFVLKTMLAGLLLTFTVSGLFSSLAQAQSVSDIRWKSEAQVRQIVGEPNIITPAVGTHASYTMWKYDDFTIAFANNRAFHLFHKDSLKKIVLDENRSQ